MAQLNTNRMFVTMLDETAWGDEGAAGNEALVPVLDGDYGIALDDPTREQQHVVGDQQASYIVQDVRNLAGSIKMGLWPHQWARVLDLALTRTSGELASVTFRQTYPGVETLVHAGCRVDSITIEGAQGGDWMLTLAMRGRHESTETADTYPGSLEVPAIPSLLFKNTRVILSLDSTGAMENAFLCTGAQNVRFTVNHNHKFGPAIEDRSNLEEDGVIAFLTAGRQTGEFSVTADFDRAAYTLLQRSRKKAQVRVVGAHPAFTDTFVVDTGGAAAGATKTVPLTANPTGVISVNDYVFFDGAGGTLPCVAKVTTVNSGDIVVDVLDYAVTAGDNVYLGGFELESGPGLVSAVARSHPFDDFITAEVAGTVFSGGDDPLTWKANDMTLP